MTRQDIINCMPIFNAIIEGKNVQIYDSVELHGNNRGYWKTVDNWGFGATDLTNYRIKNKDNTISYFKKQPKYRIHRDFDNYKPL